MTSNYPSAATIARTAAIGLGACGHPAEKEQMDIIGGKNHEK